MRTSGTATDPIALVPLVVAVVAIVMLAGGPSELLLGIERMLRALVDAVGSFVRTLGG
jgi:hypothetical protein